MLDYFCPSTYITDSGLDNSGAHLLPEGSLLVTSRATLGARVINQVPMTTNQGFKSIVFWAHEDADYYFHFFSLLKSELERRASGTTFLEISGTEFSDIDLPVPPENERDEINKILDTFDTQIRETESIIAKLQQVKQGLLHDLLTRGVDENGELRPSYEDAPELYKSSELGWIPKDWDVESLSDLSESGLMNGVFKQPSRVGKGVPLVNVADLYKGEEINLGTCEFFDATKAEKERYDVKRGDIFFTRSSLKLEGIAHTSFVNCDCKEVVFECHVIRLRPNTKKVVPLYLKEWCVGVFARQHFMANAKQVTMTTISQDGIKNLPCPLPLLEEQSQIKRMIQGFESKMTSEISLLKKLKSKKSGLMDDLLTGKKRVTNLLNQQQTN